MPHTLLAKIVNKKMGLSLISGDDMSTILEAIDESINEIHKERPWVDPSEIYIIIGPAHLKTLAEDPSLGLHDFISKLSRGKDPVYLFGARVIQSQNNEFLVLDTNSGTAESLMMRAIRIHKTRPLY